MIKNFYGVPIYHSKIAEILYDKVQDELEVAYLNSSFKMRDDWGPTHYLSNINFNDNFIEKYNLKYFSNEIKRHLGLYMEMIDFRSSPNYNDSIKGKIKTSWFSKFEKGSYAHVHNHGHHDVAGVYYFKSNEQSSELFFLSPVPQLHYTLPFAHLGNTAVIPPKQGDILLFPGWLEHGVGTNNNEETRVSVSFNICFE